MIKYDFSDLHEACDLVIANPERASSYQNLRKD